MRFWQVGIARNAVFSIVLWLRHFGKQIPKTGVAEDRLPKMSPNFAPRLRARRVWKSKSLKIGGVGAFFEVQVAKICTTPAREVWKSKSLKTGSVGALFEVQVAEICTTPACESDLEAKTVKASGSRTRTERRDFNAASCSIFIKIINR